MAPISSFWPHNKPSSTALTALPTSMLCCVYLVRWYTVPGDCENCPKKTVNLRKGSGEDVADAMHGRHLGVLLQGLHVAVLHITTSSDESWLLL